MPAVQVRGLGTGHGADVVRVHVAIVVEVAFQPAVAVGVFELPQELQRYPEVGGAPRIRRVVDETAFMDQDQGDGGLEPVGHFPSPDWYGGRLTARR